MRLTLHFVGHYEEPDLAIDADLSDGGGVDFGLAFDPLTKRWAVAPSPASATQPEVRKPDSSYGDAHREYVKRKRAASLPQVAKKLMQPRSVTHYSDLWQRRIV